MRNLRSFSVALLLSMAANFSVAQKPGDNDPKVKTLEADVFHEFNNGAAVITKGNVAALVDMGGNFLAPYGKYQFANPQLIKGLYNGIFCLSLNHEAINAKGQLIAKGLDYAAPSPSCPYLLVTGRDAVTVINADDKRFLVSGAKGMTGLGNISDGFLSYYISENGKVKSGFKNFKNEIIVQPTYDFAGIFSDGMALVGRKNEFGEMKYGFINTEGKEVVPPMYSNKPSDFHCGRSLVYPKAGADFNYGYINKKGELAIKYTQEMYQKYGQFQNGFFNGYSFNDRFVMDSSGKIMSHEAFFAKFGVSNPGDKALQLKYQISRENWMDGQVFTFTRYNTNARSSKTGFIDVNSKKSVEGSFRQTNQFYFDPVSRLAYAEMLPSDNSGKPTKKGYINAQGIFVLVKKEEGNW